MFIKYTVQIPLSSVGWKCACIIAIGVGSQQRKLLYSNNIQGTDIQQGAELNTLSIEVYT